MRSPAWLTTAQAAVHLGFTKADNSPDVHAFASWKNRLKQQGRVLPTYRIAGTSRSLRYKQVDLDRCVEPDRSIVNDTLESGARHLRKVVG